jgi:hypothetical protein
MLEAMLATFRGQGAWFLTVTDLSIWLYGDDSEADQRATHVSLCRLRKLGYVFEQRKATWESGRGGPKAYRLVSEPSSHTREAA